MPQDQDYARLVAEAAAASDAAPSGDLDIDALAEAARKAHPKAASLTKRTGSYADVLPDIGGAIGSFTARRFGPIAGAITAGIGGAAGEGYRQLALHAGELPGAITDVARNLPNPATRGATWGGAVEGATEGRTAALKAAGNQAAKEGIGRGVGFGIGQAARPLAWINQTPARVRGFSTALGTGAGAYLGHGIEGALLGRLLANPDAYRLAQRGLEVAGGTNKPASQLLRLLSAVSHQQ